MEKIRLNNGQIFELIPIGIETDVLKKRRKFSFVSELGYAEIEATFSVDNITSIDYLSADNEVLKIYTDCNGLKMIAKEFNKEYEDGKFADVYTVVLEIN